MSTLQTRYRSIAGSVINLHDYTTGGVNNATVKVQAALDAAAGGALYCPPGDYACDLLEVPSHIRIFGDGQCQFIARNAGVDLFNIEDQEDVEFDGIKMLGTAAYDAGVAAPVADSNAIHALRSSNIRIDRVYIERFLLYPFIGFECSFLSIRGSIFKRNSQGPSFGGSEDILCEGNFVDGTCHYSLNPTAAQFAVGFGLGSTDGQFYGPCKNVIWKGNCVKDFPYSEAYLVHAGDHVIIEGNRAINVSMGVSCIPFNATDDIFNLVIANNMLEGSAAETLPTASDQGITFAGGDVVGAGTVPAIGVVVKGNVISAFNRVSKGDQAGGIVFGGSRASVIQGNTIIGCGKNGIVVNLDVEDLVLTGNTIRSTVAYSSVQNGIRLIGTPTGIVAQNAISEILDAAAVGIKGTTTGLHTAALAHNYFRNVTTQFAA